MTSDPVAADAEGPVFPAAPPERIDLPGGVALVRCDPARAGSAVEAINASIDHLRPWMAWASEPATEPGMATFFALAAQLWDQRRDFGYSIIDPATGAVVGGCGLHGRQGDDALDIGYWVHVDRAGQGIATQLSRALTDAAFAIPGIRRVRIQCEEANAASARVPAKLDYRLEGVDVPAVGTCAGRRTQTWEIERDVWLGRHAEEP